MSTARARTRPTREDTVERLLDGALRVFGERGIVASSVADVAAAAGMTKGAIYSNFAGKDDLILALMERQAAGRLAHAAAVVDAAPDLEAALAGAGRVLVDELRSDAVWHRLLAEYFALSQHDDRLRASLRDRRRDARASVAGVLEDVAARFELTLPLPADELAVTLFALSNGLGVESGIDPDAVADDLLGRVLALLFAGTVG